MTSPLRSYADVEELLVGYLQGLYPTARVCTETPAQLPSGITIQVVRIAGVDRDAVDDATVSVDVYAGGDNSQAGNRITATQVANQIRAYLRLNAIGYTNGSATIAAVATISGPGWRPYDNTNVRRVGATYSVTVHNHQ